MPNWNKVLNFTPFYHDPMMTVAMKAQRIAQAIRAKFPRQLDMDNDAFDDELDLAVAEFEDLAKEPLVDPNDFDKVMERLYDWADYERVWVVTR